MSHPQISEYFKSRQPSAIRAAQIEFSKRQDAVDAVNVAIGNVSLPMHPSMQKRMFSLNSAESPFKDGVVKYSSTVGTKEANDAFLHVLKASGIDTNGLYSQITDGGSQAMELVILGSCGEAGKVERPIFLLDAAYTNYVAMANRVGRHTISVSRHLTKEGDFTLPDIAEVEEAILKHKPTALLVIPYDNPTGQLMSEENLIQLAELCVKHNLWLISDEAYRELAYQEKDIVSVWKVTEAEVPGITGRRISIETASKVWNACGLRIGAIITDNLEFHTKSVAENTANLCSNVIGQYIFAGLLEDSVEEINEWFEKQRTYYAEMIINFRDQLINEVPGIIVSKPEAAIYTVLDVRDIVDETFEASDFVKYCASKGKVEIDGKDYTLLVSPMRGFYNQPHDKNPGRTQMRIAFVETNERVKLIPKLFAELLKQYTLAL